MGHFGCAEQRVQVSPTRFRIPDVCVVLGKPDRQIFRTPPFLCIEILSQDDRMTRMKNGLMITWPWG